MAEFLQEKAREIKERIDELAPLVEEHAKLSAALEALEGAMSGKVPTAQRSGPAPTSKRSAKARPSGGGGNGGPGRPKGSGTRGKEAMELVRQRPGITIPELAEAMGIKQNYLYRVLPDLQKEGAVRKEGRGWHVNDQAAE